MTEPAVADLIGSSPQPPAVPPAEPTPAATPPAAATPPTPEAAPAGDDQRVPYSRFKEVNDQLAPLRTEVEELRRFKEEQETAKLTEIEQATRAKEQAEQRAAEAEQRALTLERSGWVTAAATTAGFVDPSDAVLDLDLSQLTDEESATQAVAALAEKKPHWLAPNQPQRPQGFGHPGGQPPAPAVPVGPDGKPDEKASFGQEIMSNLFGRK